MYKCTLCIRLLHYPSYVHSSITDRTSPGPASYTPKDQAGAPKYSLAGRPHDSKGRYIKLQATPRLG